MAEKKLDNNLITVTIAADNHTHKGNELKKGEKVDVSQSEYEFLLKHKVIEA